MVPCGMWPVRVDQDPPSGECPTRTIIECVVHVLGGGWRAWLVVVQHKIKNTMKHTLNYKAGIHIQEPTI